MKDLREFALETKYDKIAFLPGEVIRGELYICLEEPVEIKSIKVFLTGEGEGAWIRQCTPSDTESRTNTNEVIKKHNIVNIGLILFGYKEEDRSPKETHESGRFVYEFEFDLPINLPCTFKSPADKDLGYARYFLKAVLSRSKKHDKEIRQKIVINELLDPERPELAFQPGKYDEKNVKSACMPSGTLSLESYLNQANYMQGDKILINALAENKSTKIMKELSAIFIRRVHCKSRYGTTTFVSEEAKLTGARIPAQDKLEWKEHPLTIPAVGPTITGNVDIRVDYLVRVGMYEDLGSELHLDLPVVIGTVGTRKEAKENKEQEEFESQQNLMDAKREKYGLKLIKAKERSSYREALKSNNNVNQLGSNKQPNDGEINIADDDDLYNLHGSVDDEKFQQNINNGLNKRSMSNRDLDKNNRGKRNIARKSKSYDDGNFNEVSSRNPQAFKTSSSSEYKPSKVNNKLQTSSEEITYLKENPTNQSKRRVLSKSQEAISSRKSSFNTSKDAMFFGGSERELNNNEVNFMGSKGQLGESAIPISGSFDSLEPEKRSRSFSKGSRKLEPMLLGGSANQLNKKADLKKDYQTSTKNMSADSLNKDKHVMRAKGYNDIKPQIERNEIEDVVALSLKKEENLLLDRDDMNAIDHDDIIAKVDEMEEAGDNYFDRMKRQLGEDDLSDRNHTQEALNNENAEMGLLEDKTQSKKYSNIELVNEGAANGSYSSRREQEMKEEPDNNKSKGEEETPNTANDTSYQYITEKKLDEVSGMPGDVIGEKYDDDNNNNKGGNYSSIGSKNDEKETDRLQNDASAGSTTNKKLSGSQNSEKENDASDLKNGKVDEASFSKHEAKEKDTSKEKLLSGRTNKENEKSSKDVGSEVEEKEPDIFRKGFQKIKGGIRSLIGSSKTNGASNEDNDTEDKKYYDFKDESDENISFSLEDVKGTSSSTRLDDKNPLHFEQESTQKSDSLNRSRGKLNEGTATLGFIEKERKNNRDKNTANNAEQSQDLNKLNFDKNMYREISPTKNNTTETQDMSNSSFDMKTQHQNIINPTTGSANNLKKTQKSKENLKSVPTKDITENQRQNISVGIGDVQGTSSSTRLDDQTPFPFEQESTQKTDALNSSWGKLNDGRTTSEVVEKEKKNNRDINTADNGEKSQGHKGLKINDHINRESTPAKNDLNEAKEMSNSSFDMKTQQKNISPSDDMKETQNQNARDILTGSSNNLKKTHISKENLKYDPTKDIAENQQQNISVGIGDVKGTSSSTRLDDKTPFPFEQESTQKTVSLNSSWGKLNDGTTSEIIKKEKKKNRDINTADNVEKSQGLKINDHMYRESTPAKNNLNEAKEMSNSSFDMKTKQKTINPSDDMKETQNQNARDILTGSSNNLKKTHISKENLKYDPTKNIAENQQQNISVGIGDVKGTPSSTRLDDKTPFPFEQETTQKTDSENSSWGKLNNGRTTSEIVEKEKKKNREKQSANKNAEQIQDLNKLNFVTENQENVNSSYGKNMFAEKDSEVDIEKIRLDGRDLFSEEPFHIKTDLEQNTFTEPSNKKSEQKPKNLFTDFLHNSEENLIDDLSKEIQEKSKQSKQHSFIDSTEELEDVPDELCKDIVAQNKRLMNVSFEDQLMNEENNLREFEKFEQELSNEENSIELDNSSDNEYKTEEEGTYEITPMTPIHEESEESDTEKRSFVEKLKERDIEKKGTQEMQNQSFQDDNNSKEAAETTTTARPSNKDDSIETYVVELKLADNVTHSQMPISSINESDEDKLTQAENDSRSKSPWEAVERFGKWLFGVRSDDNEEIKESKATKENQEEKPSVSKEQSTETKQKKSKPEGRDVYQQNQNKVSNKHAKGAAKTPAKTTNKIQKKSPAKEQYKTTPRPSNNKSKTSPQINKKTIKNNKALKDETTPLEGYNEEAQRTFTLDDSAEENDEIFNREQQKNSPKNKKERSKRLDMQKTSPKHLHNVGTKRSSTTQKQTAESFKHGMNKQQKTGAISKTNKKTHPIQKPAKSSSSHDPYLSDDSLEHEGQCKTVNAMKINRKKTQPKKPPAPPSKATVLKLSRRDDGTRGTTLKSRTSSSDKKVTLRDIPAKQIQTHHIPSQVQSQEQDSSDDSFYSVSENENQEFNASQWKNKDETFRKVQSDIRRSEESLKEKHDKQNNSRINDKTSKRFEKAADRDTTDTKKQTVQNDEDDEGYGTINRKQRKSNPKNNKKNEITNSCRTFAPPFSNQNQDRQHTSREYLSTQKRKTNKKVDPTERQGRETSTWRNSLRQNDVTNKSPKANRPAWNDSVKTHPVTERTPLRSPKKERYAHSASPSATRKVSNIKSKERVSSLSRLNISSPILPRNEKGVGRGSTKRPPNQKKIESPEIGKTHKKPVTTASTKSKTNGKVTDLKKRGMTYIIDEKKNPKTLTAKKNKDNQKQNEYNESDSEIEDELSKSKEEFNRETDWKKGRVNQKSITSPLRSEYFQNPSAVQQPENETGEEKLLNDQIRSKSPGKRVQVLDIQSKDQTSNDQVRSKSPSKTAHDPDMQNKDQTSKGQVRSKSPSKKAQDHNSQSNDQTSKGHVRSKSPGKRVQELDIQSKDQTSKDQVRSKSPSKKTQDRDIQSNDQTSKGQVRSKYTSKTAQDPDIQNKDQTSKGQVRSKSPSKKDQDLDIQNKDQTSKGQVRSKSPSKTAQDPDIQNKDQTSKGQVRSKSPSKEYKHFDIIRKDQLPKEDNSQNDQVRSTSQSKECKQPRSQSKEKKSKGKPKKDQTRSKSPSKKHEDSDNQSNLRSKSPSKEYRYPSSQSEGEGPTDKSTNNHNDQTKSRTPIKDNQNHDDKIKDHTPKDKEDRNLVVKGQDVLSTMNNQVKEEVEVDIILGIVNPKTKPGRSHDENNEKTNHSQDQINNKPMKTKKKQSEGVSNKRQEEQEQAITVEKSLEDKNKRKNDNKSQAQQDQRKDKTREIYPGVYFEPTGGELKSPFPYQHVQNKLLRETVVEVTDEELSEPPNSVRSDSDKVAQLKLPITPKISQPQASQIKSPRSVGKEENAIVLSVSNKNKKKNDEHNSNDLSQSTSNERKPQLNQVPYSPHDYRDIDGDDDLYQATPRPHSKAPIKRSVSLDHDKLDVQKKKEQEKRPSRTRSSEDHNLTRQVKVKKKEKKENRSGSYSDGITSRRAEILPYVGYIERKDEQRRNKDADAIDNEHLTKTLTLPETPLKEDSKNGFETVQLFGDTVNSDNLILPTLEGKKAREKILCKEISKSNPNISKSVNKKTSPLIESTKIAPSPEKNIIRTRSLSPKKIKDHEKSKRIVKPLTSTKPPKDKILKHNTEPLTASIPTQEKLVKHDAKPLSTPKPFYEDLKHVSKFFASTKTTPDKVLKHDAKTFNVSKATQENILKLNAKSLSVTSAIPLPDKAIKPEAKSSTETPTESKAIKSDMKLSSSETQTQDKVSKHDARADPINISKYPSIESRTAKSKAAACTLQNENSKHSVSHEDIQDGRIRDQKLYDERAVIGGGLVFNRDSPKHQTISLKGQPVLPPHSHVSPKHHQSHKSPKHQQSSPKQHHESAKQKSNAIPSSYVRPLNIITKSKKYVDVTKETDNSQIKNNNEMFSVETSNDQTDSRNVYTKKPPAVPLEETIEKTLKTDEELLWEEKIKDYINRNKQINLSKAHSQAKKNSERDVILAVRSTEVYESKPKITVREKTASEKDVLDIMRRPKSDRRYLDQKEKSIEKGKLTPPKSVVRPLYVITKGLFNVEHSKPPSYSTQSKYSDLKKTQQPRPLVYKNKSLSRSMDESFDSFEFHEQTLGIIDDQGNVKRNSQLLQMSQEEKVAEEKERERRIKERKNKALLEDLEKIKKRKLSCPAALGTREELVKLSDSLYTEIHGSESGTEYATDEEYLTTEESASSNEDLKGHYISEAISCAFTSAKKSSNKKMANSCDYEEEIIDVYKVEEEEYIKVDKKKNKHQTISFVPTDQKDSNQPPITPADQTVEVREDVTVFPVKRSMRIQVKKNKTLIPEYSNDEVEYYYE